MLNLSKINSIRNLNLIYVFSTNSIFDKDNNRYIGIKLVYNDSSVLEVDYNDPLFGDLVKRVLERYNKEKNVRNIILLGDFTKKLIKDASFYVLEEVQEKKEQIKYYSYENKLLNKYKPYLFEIIKLIANEIYKISSFEVKSLDGFNRNFRLEYEVLGIKKSINVLLYNIDNELHFKVGSIENSNDNISGVIKQTNNKVISEFNCGRYRGSLEYDALSLESIRQIYLGNQLYYINDNSDVVLEDDKERVEYFLKQIGVDSLNSILKINDNTFLIYSNDNLEKEGEVIYRENLIFINLDNDVVRVIKTTKEGFSKYEGIIGVLLNESEDSITLRKFYDLDNLFIIKEKCENGNYSYGLITPADDIDLSSNFNIEGFYGVTLNSLDDIKQYKKGIKQQ